jgi:hypothetical protein
MNAAFDKFHSEPHSLSKLAELDTLTFPIRITVFREDDGTMPLHPNGSLEPVTQEGVTMALSILNSTYAAIKVKFVQDGPINYIDNSRIIQEGLISTSFSDEVRVPSFTSSNAHLTVFPRGSFASRLYWNGMYGIAGNGSFNLHSSISLSSTIVPTHEMGHVLGLDHTFHGAKLYDNPAAPIENSPMLFADRNKRELVIREHQPEGSVNFHLYNHKTAGDRISDTPAFGRGGSSFPDPDDPDCFVYNDQIGGVENCTSGATVVSNTCSYTGNYVDYNGHEFTNTDIGISNFMSYTIPCGNNFTTDQLLRQSMAIREDAVRVWDPTKGTLFVDSVQFWNTEVPIKNANIVFSHKEDSVADGRYSQVTTPTDGSFSAKLFDSSVKAKSIMLGRGAKNPEYQYYSDTSYVMYNYDENDWVNDVTTADIVWLTRYILGVESLNPFQKLAADVNRDGELSISDIIDIKRLILGLNVEFNNYPSGPWQFVPEVVSQDPNFLGDPFNMLLDGTAYTNEAPYIKSDFFFTPVLGETAGFDAYKLGDVNGSSMETLTEGIVPSGSCSKEEKGEMVDISSNTTFGKDESLKYQISPTSSKDISGFQVELEFDNTKLALLEKQVVLGSGLVERAAVETVGIPPGTNQNVTRWANELVKGSKTRVRLSYVFDGSGPNSSQKIDPSENMVELVFKTKEAGVNLSEAITLGTGIPFEVYQADGCVIKEDFVSDIGLKEKSFSGSKEPTAYEQFSMSVSPNPVADKATVIIKSPIDEKYVVTLYSMTTGEKVRSFSVETTGGYFYGSINTDDLPKDVILVKVKGPHTNYSTKLIKL